MPETIVEAIMARLHESGVRRVFGVPGGDCNLDFIEAGRRVGVEFVLTRTETPAAVMAAVTAELTGAPGVVMTTRGPGFANAMNGLAYASLDRAPVLLIADAYEPDLDYVAHQRFSQVEMAAPVLRAYASLDGDDPLGTVEDLLGAAEWPVPGPVYLEVTGKRVREPVPPSAPRGRDRVPETDLAALDEALALVRGSERPAVIVGLQARARPAAGAIRRLVESWKCPVFATYKAKGVISDESAYALGHYVGGVAEEPALGGADLIVLYGFDPIECPPQAWRYRVPVLELTEHRFSRHLVESRTTLVGELAPLCARVAAAREGSAWSPDELAKLKASIRQAAEVRPGDPISPQLVVEAAAAAAPADVRVSVDAGAHMLPVMHLWRARAPRDVLISRGLATMGFALPAAIGSALCDPDTPVLCCTGDGGLMMCTAELGTAVQYGCKLVVVVFNDASLTLIAAKQRRRELARAGVDFSPANFAAVAEGFGARGFRVERPAELAPALSSAFASGGVAVVDVLIDARGYDEEIVAIRG